MLVVLVVLIMLLIAAYEVPIMLRLKEWGELWAFAFTWCVGLMLGILQVTGVKIPNPTTFIIQTMPPLVDAVAALLGL